MALSPSEAASRIVAWETVRDVAADLGDGGGLDLLDLEELGQEIEVALRLGAKNAELDINTHALSVRLDTARSQTFSRTFCAPITARGPVDETYNQLQEILELHQVWFISATPFDLHNGLFQPGVFTTSMPLFSGARAHSEIVNGMDIYQIGHFAQA